MKCAKCGEEIKSGNLYCSKCGAEVQIVSAYNVVEDEFFLDFRNQEIGDASLRSVTNNRTALQKKNLYLSILTAIVGFLVLLVIAFLVRMHISNEGKEAEPGYYMQFVQALADSNDKKANACLEQSISEASDPLNDRFWMAWLYGKQGKSEKQIDVLKQILSIDGEKIYSCRGLIRV